MVSGPLELPLFQICCCLQCALYLMGKHNRIHIQMHREWEEKGAAEGDHNVTTHERQSKLC